MSQTSYLQLQLNEDRRFKTKGVLPGLNRKRRQEALLLLK